MEKNIKRKKLIIVYIILCLCFIWGQSLLPKGQSAQESGYVLEEMVHPVEIRLFGRAVSTEQLIRKEAHVFEYMMLSLGLAVYFRMRAEERSGAEESGGKTEHGGKTVCWVFSAFSAGLFAALLDETLQLFTGRGSLVSDIWIDGIGVALGVFIIWLIGRIRRKKKNV